MRSSQIVALLPQLIQAGLSVMLHGSPGVGKSDVVRQVAKTQKVDLIDLRLSQLDPVDLRGVPSVQDGLTDWNAPKFLPREGRGILFLDEINSASQATMAAAYQLILDRKLGDYQLPEGWAIVGAGNRAKDRAIVNQMSTALKNRLVHVEYEVNTDDWCEWAIKSGVCTEVLSFIRFRPTLLNEFEARSGAEEERARTQRVMESNAFATPRSWEYMSRAINAGIDMVKNHEAASGIVGEGCAAEFRGFIKYYQSTPSLDDVINNPTGIKTPDEPAVLYALATGLAAKADAKNFDPILQFAERMAVEFQVLLIKDAVMRVKELANTKAFNQWVSKHKSVLF